MKQTLRAVILITTATVAFISVARGQQGHQQHTHQHDPSEKLGQVNFKVSCTPPAQKQFNRAVAWLHSFEYEEAEKVFTEVAVTDPRCGMAYWGIAVSNYHPLWAPPTPAQLQTAASALEKAKALSANSTRARLYCSDRSFLQDAAKVDHKTRSFAYSEAMKRLHQLIRQTVKPVSSIL